MTDTNTAEREALQVIDDCLTALFEQREHASGRVPAALRAVDRLRASLAPSGFDAADMATASAQGFRDGVASIAASAGSEPVALDPRHIRKFLQALQAGEMSVARAVDILDAWLEGRYSDDMVPPPPADSCLIANDEFPMEIVRKLRSEMATHPSPPEGMAGWMPIATAPKGNPLKPGPRFLLFVKGVGAALGHVYDDGCGGFFANADGYSGNWEITHWMPLPPAPPLPASETKEL